MHLYCAYERFTLLFMIIYEAERMSSRVRFQCVVLRGASAGHSSSAALYRENIAESRKAHCVPGILL